MARGKTRVKTTTIQLRVDPQLKVAALKAAAIDHRDLSNWIEVLILARCKQINIPTPTPLSEEPQV